MTSDYLDPEFVESLKTIPNHKQWRYVVGSMLIRTSNIDQVRQFVDEMDAAAGGLGIHPDDYMQQQAETYLRVKYAYTEKSSGDREMAKPQSDATFTDATETREVPAHRLSVAWHGFIGVPCAPLTEEQSQVMQKLGRICLHQMDGVVKSQQVRRLFEDAKSQSFALAVLNKRLAALSVEDKIDPMVQLFCSTLCRNVAEAVMRAYTLNYIHVIEGGAVVDFDAFARWFPNGVPTFKASEDAWDAQKWSAMGLQPPPYYDALPTRDNWIDDFNNWPKVETTHVVASEHDASPHDASPPSSYQFGDEEESLL